MDRGPGEQPGGSPPPVPLRRRIPRYVTVFAAGLAGAVLAGALVALLTTRGWVPAVGYTVIGLGVVLLLAGGAAGGGYTNLGLGSVAVLTGGRTRSHRGGGIDSPVERLRRGLRPAANRRAFWQVVAGFGYVAVGALIVELLG